MDQRVDRVYARLVELLDGRDYGALKTLLASQEAVDVAGLVVYFEVARRFLSLS
ncbi:hypothetical protein KAR29_02685 [Aminithiophilus ramosus]|uniref:Uncharacterized protein n=2 Tax=Synergistales TaxID=649776 RepID=A0A9Q7AEH1_9BACT|nr:hypothetical protein [Aminithiophilus ramosus]QTX32849.1 hypothetical protein KAR29_02685 [Aminithiophilus ramosus]QVL36724.1 hypothetical protein KIH16_02670 [Synergistota bacterium]